MAPGCGTVSGGTSVSQPFAFGKDVALCIREKDESRQHRGLTGTRPACNYACVTGSSGHPRTLAG
jgi:hypothetical protein